VRCGCSMKICPPAAWARMHFWPLLTLAESQGEKHMLAKAAIEEDQPSPLSTMPEGLENCFTEEEFIDLVTFLLPAVRGTWVHGSSPSRRAKTGRCPRSYRTCWRSSISRTVTGHCREQSCGSSTRGERTAARREVFVAIVPST
jgi:hypothetical protein